MKCIWLSSLPCSEIIRSASICIVAHSNDDCNSKQRWEYDSEDDEGEGKVVPSAGHLEICTLSGFAESSIHLIRIPLYAADEDCEHERKDDAREDGAGSSMISTFADESTPLSFFMPSAYVAAAKRNNLPDERSSGSFLLSTKMKTPDTPVAMKGASFKKNSTTDWYDQIVPCILVIDFRPSKMCSN